jgi:D-serine deaminase-like pyridoxal phosphate-dependent protein
MQNFIDIEKPTLVLNRAVALANIERMATRALKNGVRFRPHFKTHQSVEIGEWFRPYGVKAITVSSVDMALYFADAGWKDITIAFPLNRRQIEAVDELARRVRLGLLLESVEAAAFLGEHLRHPADVWLKVDVGSRRTGIPWDQPEAFVALARAVQSAGCLALQGILAHAGHTYQAGSPAGVRKTYVESVERMNALRQQLRQAGIRLEVSVGDTPGCSLVDDLRAVDEIRPGNFVFYDAMQLQIGACTPDEVAVAVACPLVAKHPERGEAVIYGGAIHLSKEFIEVGGERCYGLVALPDETRGWGPVIPGATVTALSQEHGVVRLPTDALSKLRPGDLLMVIPVHSCLAVDLLQRYRTLEGRRITTLGKR